MLIKGEKCVTGCNHDDVNNAQLDLILKFSIQCTFQLHIKESVSCNMKVMEFGETLFANMRNNKDNAICDCWAAFEGLAKRENGEIIQRLGL